MKNKLNIFGNLFSSKKDNTCLDMKTVNLQAKLLGEDNKQALKKNHPTKPDIGITLFTLIREGLMSHNGELDPKTVERRYDLYEKIKSVKTVKGKTIKGVKEEDTIIVESVGSIDLSKEERGFILDLILPKFDVQLMGQVIKLLK